METFITVIHVITAFFMILIVLVQGGNAGGVGAAFGGGNTQGVFGASGATSFLGKLTYAMAAVFMTTSISLSILQGNSGQTGLKERLEKKTEQQQQPASQPSDVTKQPEATGTPSEAPQAQ